jgi:hypothetical protein
MAAQQMFGAKAARGNGMIGAMAARLARRQQLELGGIVAVDQLSRRRHGGLLPIPALAFVQLALSAARRLDASRLHQAALRFLADAPVNVARLEVRPTSALGAVIAALRSNPCHAILTELHVGSCSVSVEAAALLLDATNGLLHVRALHIAGPGSRAVATAAQRTLRELYVEDVGPVEAFELPLARRLRWFSIQSAPALAALDLSHTLLRDVDVLVASCGALRSVKLPATLRQLGHSACDGCESLAAIDLSHTAITDIGSSFCNDAVALGSVAMPPLLARLGSLAFRRCTRLAELDMSRTALQHVNDSLCTGCTALSSIAFPPTLQSLGGGALGQCASLTAVDLSHTALVRVGGRFLENCTALTGVRLPASLAIIEERAFFGCAALPAIDLAHTSVVALADSFMHDCGALAAVGLPPALHCINDACFWGCVSLQALDLTHTRVAEVGSLFMRSCTNLTAVALPATLEVVGSTSFRGCPLLADVTLLAPLRCAPLLPHHALRRALDALTPS